MPSAGSNIYFQIKPVMIGETKRDMVQTPRRKLASPVFNLRRAAEIRVPKTRSPAVARTEKAMVFQRLFRSILSEKSSMKFLKPVKSAAVRTAPIRYQKS
jgi:hypothetical protein